MHQRLLSNARVRHVPAPRQYTQLACRLRRVRTHAQQEPRRPGWFNAYLAALRTQGDMYDKPLVDTHQLAEQIAGADRAAGPPIDAGSHRMALAACFLAGCMLALVTVRAVSPASETCAPTTAAAMQGRAP